MLQHCRLEGKAVDGISPEMEHVFLLKDCVHLTDVLIADLTNRGWPHDELQGFRERGGHYCAPRQSIIFLEPQGLEITLESGKLMDHIHQLIGADGKPFQFSR
jgi:hypothetical protein